LAKLWDKISVVAEMGDRCHNRHGPKRGGKAAVPVTQGSWVSVYHSVLGRGLLPYQAASSSIQPFGYNRQQTKNWGLCPF